MEKIGKKLALSILFLLLSVIIMNCWADEFRVTIAGFDVSIEGEKEGEMTRVLESFPLKEKDLFVLTKEINKNFEVKKEFEFSFNAKDNILTVIEPVLEWGKIHLELKLIPQGINDILVEFDVRESSKKFEEELKKYGIPFRYEKKVTGGRWMYKLGKVDKLYASGVQLSGTKNTGEKEEKVKTSCYVRTILIERK